LTVEAAAALTYPFSSEPTPADASVIEVARGILWLRMPLQGRLQFINVWLLSEADGYSLVDTGVFTAPTVAAWQKVAEGVLKDKPITRIIATHMHPDHCGMVGWLVERFGARLWMSRLEYLMCRLMAADTGQPAPPEGLQFFRAAGWDEEAVGRYRERFGGFGKAIAPFPAAFQRLSDNDEIVVGSRRWRVVVGRGHSPEHVCLYCEEAKLLISGDQVLPRISSNVSVFPTEPDADPLHDWLTTLAGLRDRVPDEVLVLPAHNSPFFGLHARIHHLIAGHERNLERLLKRLSEPCRVIDVFGELFARPIVPEVLGMATGEALAHLNYLIHRGRARRRADSQGVDWYSSV
jgi:glyoxylase-like metal-dependent hydrolase (beta-lactamase superfamily II)